MSHSRSGEMIIARIWDKDGHLRYAETVKTFPKPYQHESYTITIPDSDLGEIPDGGYIDFMSLLPEGGS